MGEKYLLIQQKCSQAFMFAAHLVDIDLSMLQTYQQLHLETVVL